MEEKKNIPEIRFKGFEGEWEENIFGSTFTYLTSNTLSRAELNYKTGTYKNIHYGDVLIKFGELLDIRNDQIPFITHDKVAEKINSSILQNGDVVIADTAEDESVGKCTELYNIEHEKVVSGLHTIPVRPIGSFASKYLGYYMNSPSFHNQLIQLMQGIKVLSVSKSSIRNTTIKYPAEKKEQSQIGSFFQNLDKQITLEQQKHNKLVTLKKAMLEKMFPKEGKDIPEIRFKGFEENWEEKQLKNISDITGGGTPSTTVPEYWNGEIDWYSPTEIGNKVYVDGSVKKITSCGLNNSSAKILPKNKTILFTSRAGIGDMAILKKNGATNQGFQSFVVKNGIEPYFIYSAGHLIKTYALKHASGSTFLEVSGKTLGEMDLLIPSEYEQTKIGSFFQNLDKLISLQQKKIDKLKNIKKACLEKMFV